MSQKFDAAPKSLVADKGSFIEQLEAAKKQLEVEAIYKTSSATIPNKRKSIDEKVRETIEDLQKEMDKYKEIQDKIKDLKFKEGDVAFHPKHGNILIRQVLIYDFMNRSGISCKDVENDGNPFCYEILTLNGPVLVPVSEVLPVTELNKVLYGK